MPGAQEEEEEERRKMREIVQSAVKTCAYPSLATSRFGSHEDVAAAQDERDGLGLDVRRQLPVQVLDRANDLRHDAEL